MKKKIDYPEIDIDEADSIYYSKNQNVYYDIVKPLERSSERFIIKKDLPEKPYSPRRITYDPFKMINIIRKCESFPKENNFLSRYSEILKKIYRVMLKNSLVYPNMIIRGIIISSIQSYTLNLSQRYEDYRVKEFCERYGVLDEDDCFVTKLKEVRYQNSSRIGFEDEKIPIGKGQRLQTFKYEMRETIQRILYLRNLSKRGGPVCSDCESCYGQCKSDDKYPHRDECDKYDWHLRCEISDLINKLITKIYPELIVTEKSYRILHRYQSLKEEIGFYLLKAILGEIRLKRCKYCHRLFEVTFDQQEYCPPEKPSKNGKPYSKSPCKNLYDKYGCPKKEWDFNHS